MKKISGNVRNYPSNSKLPSSTVVHFGARVLLDLKFDMVWLNRLPIPVGGRRGVISNDFYLPFLAWRKGGAGFAEWLVFYIRAYSKIFAIIRKKNLFKEFFRKF
jgi:hypothetical protein